MYKSKQNVLKEWKVKVATVIILFYFALTHKLQLNIVAANVMTL